eukprot:7175893-Lingulodinium_polyedra.AAC.1
MAIKRAGAGRHRLRRPRADARGQLERDPRPREGALDLARAQRHLPPGLRVESKRNCMDAPP